jgi:hypothetical protein
MHRRRRVGRTALVCNDLLRAQSHARRFFAGQRERLVNAVGMQ